MVIHFIQSYIKSLDNTIHCFPITPEMSLTAAPASLHRTTVALFSQSADLGFLLPLLRTAAPTLDVVLWPDPRCRDAEVAVGWDAPTGMYAQMPHLRLVHSLAAGVDNLIDGHDVRGAAVCRVIDPALADGMVQYVLWAVLHFHRQFDRVLQNQREGRWERPRQTPAAAYRIGLLGLGELGRVVASALTGLGYGVSGWSRTPRTLDGVHTFSGDRGLRDMLAQSQLLVCLLPLTPQTRAVLNASVFEQLPKGAALVHCGRGEHLVEADLLQAIRSGQLRGAVLDVFEREPLRPEHAFWHTPGVVVTPHMATMADTDTVVRQVVDNIARLQRGEALSHRVDLERGY